MRRLLVLALVAAMTLATFSNSVQAAEPLLWKGQSWEVSGPGSAEVSGDQAELRRTGTGLVELHVNRVLDAQGTAALAAATTPWVQFSYIDDGSYEGIDLFVEHEEHPLNFRLSGGSLFSDCDGIGYSRHSNPAQENFDFVVGCPSDPPGRELTEHTVYAGRRADGTIDWKFDGAAWASTFLKDAAAANGTPPISFNDIHLRWRDQNRSAGSVTFTDFQWGADHAAPVPGAPAISNVKVGDARATVSWTAPLNDGGAPITGYVVTASPGGRTATTDAATLTATVDGLTNDTEYTFTVQATSRVGTGAASAPSGAVTAGRLPWKGQLWEVIGPGMAEVTEDRAVLTRTGTGMVELFVNRILDAEGEAALSASDTPWVQFSYIDDGSYEGIDLFVEHPEHPYDFRLSGGSLFSDCDGIGYSRHSNPAEENFDFVVGCPSDTPGRERVQHTVFAGKRADGTIDWAFDGVPYPSTFL